MLSLHRSLKTRQVREMDIIRTNHQEIDQELFAKAVKEIVYRSPSIVWLSEARKCDLDQTETEKIWERAQEYCKEYDTPSCHLWTALDKFIYHYVKLGYTWTFCHNEAQNTDDNILFTRGAESLLAIAEYGTDDGQIKIIGYGVKPISNE